MTNRAGISWRQGCQATTDRCTSRHTFRPSAFGKPPGAASRALAVSRAASRAVRGLSPLIHRRMSSAAISAAHHHHRRRRPLRRAKLPRAKQPQLASGGRASRRPSSRRGARRAKGDAGGDGGGLPAVLAAGVSEATVRLLALLPLAALFACGAFAGAVGAGGAAAVAAAAVPPSLLGWRPALPSHQLGAIAPRAFVLGDSRQQNPLRPR